MKHFIEAIEELDEILKLKLDKTYKDVALHKFMGVFGIKKDIGEFYFSKILNADKKIKGIVYTPEEISNYIIRRTIEAKDVIENPFIKICDPSCGVGNILVPLFHYLKEIYLENIEFINKKNNMNLTIDMIEDHIVKNNIFGYDIDKTAIQITKIKLFRESGIYNENIILKDFLVEPCEKVDCYIGNPPYIGHKDVEKKYVENIRTMYKEVYKDKSDIHFCFFKKSIDTLNIKGKISFITSRYFLESKSAINLREYIRGNISIREIIDFYGVRPFKNIGVDPCIIFLTTENIENIKVVKPMPKVYNKSFLKYFHDNRYGKVFFISNEDLGGDSWCLLTKEERNIVRKIEKKSSLRLKDICNSYQGVITGCDKAFILNTEETKENFIERDIIRPWIKSTNIDKYNVLREDKYIIYSNLIGEEKEYPNAIKYISTEKERLKNRREVLKGYRKWYELQWGRDCSIFEKHKIVFPYKSKNNRFALDKGSYFSADVYALILKEECEYDYDFILKVLNSPLYEFYFKTFAKKLGENLYEYYPNTLMEILIPPKDFTIMDEEGLFRYFSISESEKETIFSFVNI